jgi:copper chaperone CopZ
MEKLVATVAGLTCQHCVNTVTRRLEEIDGIDTVAVDLVNGGSSTVELTGELPDNLLPVIAQALAEEGYSLESLSASEGQ